MDRRIEHQSAMPDVKRQRVKQEMLSWDDDAIYVKPLDSTNAEKLNQKEEEMFKIVKEIPKELFEPLYYNGKTSRMGDMLGNAKENTKRFAQLHSLNEFVKILRAEASSSHDTPVSGDYDKSDIGCILLHTNEILNRLNSKIQGLAEFHSHIKSKLADLGFESPAQ